MQSATSGAGISSVGDKYVCKQCSKEYKPKHSARITYCSRECYFEYRRLNPSQSYIKSCAVYAAYCIGCGSPYVSKRKQLYCGGKCESRRVSLAPETKTCKCCNAIYKPAFTGGAISDYCSKGCLAMVKASRKRIDKAKRKAVLRGATVEKVDPFKVFDRDGWRCQLCGIKTPKSKRGTYDDDAPELDHIMPLAKGGEHSYINTQCSCRKCNGLKSDKPMGQMKLIG